MISRADFDEDTAFERFAIARLGTYATRPMPATFTQDLRSREMIVVLGAVETGTALRDQLRRDLQPLAFAAAYKIVDLLIEHVLRDNGARGRLTFERKRRLIATRPRRLPTPLRQRPALWDRLTRLYDDLAEPRHAVVHRRARITPDGDLELFDDARQPIGVLALGEIEDFVAAAHAIAELVIDASTDRRRLVIAAEYVNRLHARHGLRLLPASSGGIALRRLRMDVQEVRPNVLRIDVTQARAAIAHQRGDPFWDLELFWPGTPRVFVARWDEMPHQRRRVLDFVPDLPPRWITELSPLESGS